MNPFENLNVKITPMLAQWIKEKKNYPDAILLFRMGDFYELFDKDAEIAAPILDIALTARDKQSPIKMAGFPHHSAQSYIGKLIDSGYKVAICEQLEDPKATKGIVKRGVTELFTPATYIEKENTLGESNFLLAIVHHKNTYALCALDISGSHYLVCSTQSFETFLDEINRLNPKEIVTRRTGTFSEKMVSYLGPNRKVERVEAFRKKCTGEDCLNEAENHSTALLETYLATLKGSIPRHVGKPKKYSISNQLLMDSSTRTNLNLFPSSKDDKSNLLKLLSNNKTSMGKRYLYQSLLAPSTCLDSISQKLDVVEKILSEPQVMDALRGMLAKMSDVEKLVAMVETKKISPKSLASLRDSLEAMNEIKKFITTTSCFSQNIPDIGKSLQDLAEALVETPPLTLKDGRVFKESYNGELKELYSLSTGSQSKLLEIEGREKQQTGIPSLKVRFNRVFGYYIEVTKSHLSKVPPHYFRKQTLANAERFVTEELNELEILINSSKDKIFEKENELYQNLLERVLENGEQIVCAAKTIGMLDCLTGFAHLAWTYNWSRPKVLPKESCCLEIHGGRHPIVEGLAQACGENFVPNDISLSSSECIIALITGPNMAGKSTIMRQAALIQIMAQMGCFVPADKASLSICDAIFARVGASDNLALGCSTFMVEMKETAQILNQATEYSLILLDEIGRGTSTYDGLAIAQAVAEFLHEEKRSRTLFATHYHELTMLDKTLNRLKNFHVEVEESKGEISFLYTLKEGFLGKSFGIQVANLAGLPKSVLKRADSLLEQLETQKEGRKHSEDTQFEEPSGSVFPSLSLKRPQLALFLDGDKSDASSKLAGKVLSVDVNRLTPIGALNKINEWQRLLKG